jgi:hypothetical protein
MIKKLVFGFSSLFFVAGICHAEEHYGMAGCGLGSMVIDSKSNFMQVLAFTTNGTSFSQSFGITLGTSNCLPASHKEALNNQQQFIIGNLETLSKEMAQGSGGSIQSLAATFSCSQDSLPVFASQMQNSYEKIFAEPGAISVLNAIKDEVKANQGLASACPMAAI